MIAFILAVFTGGILAQTSATAPRPDFSGRWTFDAAASRITYPPPAAIREVTVVIAHRDPTLRFRRDFVTDAGHDTLSWTLTTDSTAAEVIHGAVRATSWLSWRHDTLQLDSRIVTPERTATNVVQYSLRDAGRTLVAHEVFRAPNSQHDNWWVFRRATAGARYFGEWSPGDDPVPLAHDTMAAWGVSRTPALSGDGAMMVWARSTGQFRSALLIARFENGAWSKPETLPFSKGEWFDHSPALSPDGRLLVFASNRPVAGKAATTIPGTPVPASDLFVVERRADGWSDPLALGPEVNTTGDEDSPCLTSGNALYFSSSRPGSPGPGAIYRAEWSEGGWSRVMVMPAPVTTGDGELVWYVTPDENLILYTSLRAGEDGGLRLARREPDGAWRESQPLPERIRSMRAYAPGVSSDGQWLLFTAPGADRRPALYWVDAGVLGSAGLPRR